MNSFVEFVQEDERVELSDFTRDGYQTVFVRIVEESVWGALQAAAEEEGYFDCGEYEHLETMERVRMLSTDSSKEGERVTVYSPVEES